MYSDLNDPRSILQVIGCVLQNPDLLDDYALERDDFDVEAFHEIVFAAINNLYQSGVSKIDNYAVDQFLSSYPKQYQIFNDNNGLEWLNNAIDLCEPENFLYYYQRLKKFSYLRFLEKNGTDTTFLYDTRLVEPDKVEAENAKFDSMTLDDMMDKVETKFVTNAKLKFTSESEHHGQIAKQGMRELKESFKLAPDFGLNFLDPITTTVTRGARLKKFYLYSSNQGGGKSRMAMAAMCQIAIPYYYDTDKKEWVYTETSEPALFISTELDFEELQTIILAHVSGVPEDHITDGKYQDGEEERVDQAISYIEAAPLYLEFLPDFAIADVENIIKKYKRTFGVSYVAFDYIHTSAKLIAEISSTAHGVRIREDQCLFLLSDTLKNLCNTLDIFILSGTQLNDGWKTATEKDSTILRGAKSLADRIDIGAIFLEPSHSELESIKPILARHENIGMPQPNRITHIYKCRRGKYTKVRLWQYADLATARIMTLFVTDNDSHIIPIKATTVVTEEVERLLDEHSVTDEDIQCTKEEQEEAMKTFFDF